MPSITDSTNELKDVLFRPEFVPLAEKQLVPSLKYHVSRRPPLTIIRNLLGLQAAFVHEDACAAIAHYNKALFHNAYEPSYHLHQAEVYLDLGDFSSACSSYYYALQLEPRSVFLQLKTSLVYRVSGQICLDLGHYERAYRQFKLSLICSSSDPITKLCMTLALIGLNKPDPAITLLNEIIEDQPEMTEALLVRAKLRLRTNSLMDAFKDLNRIIDITGNIHPEIQTVTRRIIEKSTEFKSAADEQAEKGRIQVSLQLLNQAIKIYPRDESLYFRRATLFHIMGRLDESVADFQRVKNKDEHVRQNESRLYADYSTVLLKKSMLNEALEMMNKAIALYDKSVRFYEKRGDCLTALGRLEEAIQDYEMLPEVTAKKIAVNRVRVAEKCFKAQDDDQGKLHLDRAIELDANNIEAFVLRCRYYIRIHDLAKAQKEAEAALQLDPHYGPARLLCDQIQSEIVEVDPIDAVEGYHIP